jgi:hypothetical protein
MNKEVPLKQIVTVSEMSRMCRLSRARFYQLINEGIFPTPSRNEQTKRPFFSREQQEQCLEIRRSNRGANGKAIMFYGCRPQAAPKLPSKRKQFPISKPRQTENLVVSELRHGLAQLGMANMTEQTIREALARAFPDGHQEIESSELLRTVFEAIQCRDSADKLSG